MKEGRKEGKREGGREEEEKKGGREEEGRDKGKMKEGKPQLLPQHSPVVLALKTPPSHSGFDLCVWGHS
jgi:hypothetical protein